MLDHSPERRHIDRRPLPQSEWLVASRKHQERLKPLADAASDRRSRHESDPVEDFLWEYYDSGPRRLLRWSPGIGVVLQGPETRRFLGARGFMVEDDRAWVEGRLFPAKRRPFLLWLRDLCQGIAQRPMHLACAGMHEWAMLYQAEDRRHPATSLRVEPALIARTLETHGLSCTHFDATRFFTEAARPLHPSLPDRNGRLEDEQRACLHVNMDLYRWTLKLFPWTSSDLVADTVELALKIRQVDMRASPYDLSAWGLSPIPVENEAGRREYRRHQLGFAATSEPLRERLVETVDALLAATPEEKRSC